MTILERGQKDLIEPAVKRDREQVSSVMTGHWQA